MEQPVRKPTIPEVLPLVREWYTRPGNGCGGIFHIILEDGNHERRWADHALEDARKSKDEEAIRLAELLCAMSPTQRQKLSQLGKGTT